MKNVKYIFLLFVLLSLPICYFWEDVIGNINNEAHAQSLAPNYEIVWSDEFNQESRAYDKSKWIISWWNKYCENSSSVAYCENGNLVLKAIKNPDLNSQKKYLCGCVCTKNKAEFLYGKIEVRAKFSNAQGAWPAIWFCPVDTVYGAWPKSGEIDLMEHLNNDTIALFNLHCENRRLNVPGTPFWSGAGGFKINDFNVYGMVWEKDKLSFFINDKLCYEYPRIPEMKSNEWPFDIPFYLILNIVVGGWAGEIDESQMPFEMLVDYVRYYKLKE